jgi:phenylpyruvate tautomerase PptA (4-oxalocrotonate tautomerase family)
MPCLSLKTNVLIGADAKLELMKEASALLAECTGKPESYCMVILEDQIALSFGGDATMPTAYLSIQSIGKLGVAQNKKISASFCQWVQRAFQVDPSRTYLSFRDVPASEWGWNGSTFA